MKICIPFLLTVLFLVSCDKEEEQPLSVKKTFSGIVLDYSTNQPVANAVVKLVRFEYGVFFGEGVNPALIRELRSSLLQNIRVDSVLTDSQGKYSMELDISVPPFNNYIIGSYKDGYTHPYIVPATKSKNRDTIYDTTYLDKNSYLKLVINNVAPAVTTDSFGIRTWYLGANGQNSYIRFPGRDSVTFLGLTNNAILMDTISFKAFPQARIRWTTMQNGVATNRDSVVNLDEFNVTEVVIDY